MLEQASQAIAFYAFFTASKTGKAGLSVTIDVYRDGTQIVTAASATAVGGGLYRYVLASGSTATAGSYAAIFKTSDTTVDVQHIPSLWVVGQPWVAHVDADVSSRLASSAYTAPPSTNDIDALLTTSHGAGSWQTGAAGLTASEIWSHPSRTLTTPAASLPATVAGMALTLRRGDDWSATLTGLGDLTGAGQLWLTAKKNLDDADDWAMLQITLSDGLLRLNGAAATDPGAGSITIDDAAAGTITMTLTAAMSAALAAGVYAYDVQAAVGGGVATLTPNGVHLTIVPDVTRAVA